MKKILITFGAALLFVSCSNLSKNLVKEGDFSISSGRVGKYKWNDSLNFKRVSWYHELTLLLDMMYVKIDEKAPFYNWFSLDEKTRISNCSEKLLVISYALDSDRLSQVMLRNKIKDYGYEDIAIPHFSKSLKSHPDFERLSLTLYKVDLFCKKSKQVDDMFITFPNYDEIKL